MKNKKMFLLDLFLAVLVGIDQFTKYLAVVFLKGQEPFVLIPGVLELKYLENRGRRSASCRDRSSFLWE